MAYRVDFRTADPSATVFAQNGEIELTTITENGVDTTFTYNDWGRTVSKQKTAGQTTYTARYTYFAGDKLKRVLSNFPGEAGDVAFNHDGLGKRRNKLVNDTDVTWYRWDAGWGMIAEYAGQSGSWTVGAREMSYLEGMVQVPGDDPSSGTYAVFGKDHLGSTRSLFNGSKAETARLDYMPCGEERLAAGDVPAKRYTGHTWDAETGLYFAPYRYYSPTTSRWLTRDPLGMVDGPNVYGYVRGDPIGSHDALGLSFLPPWALAGGGACALADGPLPAGDVVGGVIFIGGVVYATWQYIGPDGTLWQCWENKPSQCDLPPPYEPPDLHQECMEKCGKLSTRLRRAGCYALCIIGAIADIFS